MQIGIEILIAVTPLLVAVNAFHGNMLSDLE